MSNTPLFSGFFSKKGILSMTDKINMIGNYFIELSLKFLFVIIC